VWLVAAVAAAAVIPWDTAIESNGMRVVLIVVFGIAAARVAMSVHGAVPPRVPGVGVEAPSPDLVGVDRPITRSDAMDAARALGIDESVFGAGSESDGGRTPLPVAGA
jgi:hypothetical protein